MSSMKYAVKIRLKMSTISKLKSLNTKPTDHELKFKKWVFVE